MEDSLFCRLPPLAPMAMASHSL